VAYEPYQGVAVRHPLGVRGSLLPVPLGDVAVNITVTVYTISLAVAMLYYQVNCHRDG
jgi:hypothetical protein